MDSIAKTLRKRLTDSENVVWKHLRAKQLEGLKFRRQEPIGKYIVDFVCYEKRVVIEVDGGQHSTEGNRDEVRDRWLREQGFKVLRFWNNEVLTNIEGVLEVIRENCLNHPPLTPPIKGGEMKRISHFIFLVLIFKFFFVTSSAYAWKLPIEVATGSDDEKKAYNKLVVGIESSATDGFDNLWDTPAILSHPDPESPLALRAYLEGQGGDGEPEMDRLWKDIRSTTTKGDTVWEIAVDSVPKGKAVDISWNVPQGLLKAGERLVLRDNDRIGTDGKPAETDMTWASTYSFVSESEEPRSLSLVLSRETVKRSRSGSGSGFGCGTVKGTHKGGPSGDGTGTAVMNIIVLFLPIVFLRLLRLMKINHRDTENAEVIIKSFSL